MPTFDPWNDAQALAHHLAQPTAELLVVIGAESWCQKCKRLKPAFDTLCNQSMPAQVAWMWLDLEDHADFLDGFIPPDLPLLMRWRAGQCVQVAVVEDIQPELPPAERVRLRTLPSDGPDDVAPPDLWESLKAVGWATG